MQKIRKLFALLLALSMLLALAACGPTDSNADNTGSPDPAGSPSAGNPDEPSQPVELDGEAQYGGTVTLYYNADINVYYDPAINDTAHYCMWMESLFAYDTSLTVDEFQITGDNVPSTALTGQLAESWDWDEANGVLTVKLRDDVFFQEKEPYNGRKFVANDVKWSYDRILGIGSGYTEPLECQADWFSRLNVVESIECPDDTTVVFQFSDGNHNSVAYETFMTTFLKIGGPEWDTLTPEQQQSVDYASGTGPYILTDLVAATSVSLTKNPNYYGTDTREGLEGNQLPYIDNVNFIYIADSTNIASQFVSGEIDWFGYRANLIGDSEEAQIQASGANYYKYSWATGQPEAIALRCNAAPFNDVRVRKALQYAIDLNTINAGYFGYDTPLEVASLWNPILEDWTMDQWPEGVLEEYTTYDPEMAKQLLTEAGYPDGFEFTVVISGDNDIDLFTYVNATYFAPIGVTMNLETVSNFFEAKSVGNTENDPRSCATTGVAAINSLTAAMNQTLDGGWAAALWHGEQEYHDMMNAMQAASTTGEQATLAKQLDEYYVSAHWATYLSGLKVINEYFSARLQGYEPGNRLYSGKTFAAVLSHMWVNDAA